MDKLNISTPSLDTEVQPFRRKPAEGGHLKWICSRANIIFMDEPTRGVDVGQKGQIYELMNEMVKSGKQSL